jgi:hypothetical protein
MVDLTSLVMLAERWFVEASTIAQNAIFASVAYPNIN